MNPAILEAAGAARSDRPMLMSVATSGGRTRRRMSGVKWGHFTLVMSAAGQATFAGSVYALTNRRRASRHHDTRSVITFWELV